MTIRVLYTCVGCGVEKAPLHVRARLGEDLMTWMDATMYVVHDDHRDRSPHCQSQHVDLMIPVPPGTERVGGTAVN